MSKLDSAIREFGGKHGVLQVLSEEEKTREYILPTVLWKEGETPNLAEVEANRIRLDVHGSILRTSEQSDWAGMVDVMPTKPIKDEKVDDYELDMFEESVDHNSMEGYSNDEGSGYVARNLTRSLTPLLPGNRGTLTEHPNNPNLLLIDTEILLDGGSRDMFKASEMNTDGDPLHLDDIADLEFCFGLSAQMLKQIADMRKIIRETGLFSDTDSLQYEYGFLNGAPVLHQIRFFAAQHFAEWSLDTPEESGFDRAFGVTDLNGISLPSVYELKRKSLVDRGRELGSSYLMSLGNPSDPFDYDGGSQYLYPINIKGYMPHLDSFSSMALGHQNTRFVQAALKNDGVALLTCNPEYHLGSIDQVNLQFDGKGGVVIDEK